MGYNCSLISVTLHGSRPSQIATDAHDLPYRAPSDPDLSFVQSGKDARSEGASESVHNVLQILASDTSPAKALFFREQRDGAGVATFRGLGAKIRKKSIHWVCYTLMPP